MQFKRFAILSLLLICAYKIKAQNYNITNERTFEHLFQKELEIANFHTGIKPYSKNEVNAVINYDSTLSLLNYNKENAFVKNLANKNMLKINAGKFSLSLDPVINIGITSEKSNSTSNLLNETALGLNLKSSFGKKWSGEFLFLVDKSDYVSHINDLVEEKNISPGYGYSDNDRSIFSQGNITFTADDHFNFQAGYGKNFIGDGYRSLLLSDNANSYPYLKVTADIWKIKYISLYTNFQDIRFSDGNYSNYKEKFSIIHYLSFNATNWLNFGFFESIIFKAQEGNFYRGFEVSYINPIIFLRPTEFAQGSSDNALLGGSLKLKIKRKNILYGQLLFDEFLLKELKARSGWWGNKFGVQAGLKMYDFLTIKNLKLQVEYNIVRPFTYSHFFEGSDPSSAIQSYGHFNASLAHPLGANFKETTLALSYHKKRWIFESLSTIAKVGFDPDDDTSIGQDIFRPNNNRVNDFGNFTTQGITTDIINSTLKVSYILNPKSQFVLQAGITNRSFKNSFSDTSNNFFFFGLKTSITNRYFDI